VLIRLVSFLFYTLGGHTNKAFEEDTEEKTEAIQSKALPWRREEVDIDVTAQTQKEFPTWINNKDYLPYTSPTNTLMGKHISFLNRNSTTSILHADLLCRT
jgi:hypothetical protein